MKRFLLGTAKRVLKALFFCAAGGALVLAVLAVWYLESRPELDLWHEARLDAEFSADAPLTGFEAYLALETRLFEQLDRQVVAEASKQGRNAVNRYIRGSLSDPGRWPVNWNRTFELPYGDAKAGVLLLHGMSDSPYSLRSIGQRLHSLGAWVVGLRLPGHGSAPSGLVTIHWKDMAAAVRLATAHLKRQVGSQPVYIVGYSNGGALAVHYALSSLTDDALPGVAGLVLISPAVGVSRLAALAVWQARIGNLLGLKKLAWNSILPEYDPFKYQSFAVNAGDQAYRLTLEIQKRLDVLSPSGDLERFPPVLAFQSAVDATVSTRALVAGLFAKLPPGGHELVLFDINRMAEATDLLAQNPAPDIEALFDEPGIAFTVSLVTNRHMKDPAVVLRRRLPGQEAAGVTDIGLAWPAGVYSLSHVALPFPADDPLYGALGTDAQNTIHLGSLEARGERGVLQVPAADMLRLKWNPFYRLLEKRLVTFLRLETSPDSE
jgi:alpha-beta hydrolase superfamily lysophospholipase